MIEQVNQSLPTYFIVHGYTDHADLNINSRIFIIIHYPMQHLSCLFFSDWMSATGKRILEIIGANVILVDYGSVSYCNYVFLADVFVYDLGEYIADCIRKWDLQLNQTRIIGHSLGAHIAGIAGTYLDGEIDEITGSSKEKKKFFVVNLQLFV